MLKLAKYYLLINLYRKNKRSLLIVLVSIVMMITISFIFSDLTGMAESKERYFLVGIKWLLLFCLLGLIAYQLRKISQQSALPFEKNASFDVKREQLMAKEKLQSRSDMIINKYRSVQ